MADTAAVPIVEVPVLPGVSATTTARARHWAVALACVGAAALLVAAWIAGVRLFVVDSPSMGRAAPVGTLVVSTVSTEGLAIGDVVTYRAPGASGRTYTHRIVQQVRGGFRVRGDANGVEDPWVVTPQMIVARAVALVPGIGWLIRAAPILAAAIVAVELAGRFLPVHWRAQARLLGASLAVAVTSVVHRPFTGFLVVQSVQLGRSLHVTLASEALLPLRFTGSGHATLDLAPGAAGTLVLSRHGAGVVRIAAQPDLGAVGWTVVALVCLIPVLAVLLFGVRMEEDGEPDAAPA